MELVAEGKDELMEEFFETGTIPEEHLVPALHEAIREDKLFPVLFTSGLGNIGGEVTTRGLASLPRPNRFPDSLIDGVPLA